VFSFDRIFKIDRSIIVGIIVVQGFNRDVIDIFTIPGTITGWDGEWTITIDMTVIWTVFISPIVFNHNNTGVDFTSIGSTITVEVTVSVDFI